MSDTAAIDVGSVQRTNPLMTNTVEPPNIMKKLMVRLPFALLRLWWYFLIVLILGGVVGAMLAKKNSKQTWIVDGTLVFTNIPIPNDAKGMYDSPQLKTMCNFIKSPNLLAKVIEEAELPINVQVLSKLVDYETSMTRQDVGITMSTENPEEGILAVNKLMELFPLLIADLRKNQVRAYIDDMTGALNENTGRLKDAQTRLNEFNASLNVVDGALEEVNLIADIDTAVEALEKQQRLKTNLESMIGKVEALVRALKETDEAADKEEKNAEAAQESLADNRRRQDRLNELVFEEREKIKVNAQVKAKQKEFDRALELYEQDFISKAECEKLEAQLKSLIAIIEENSNIKEWKAELERLDQMVVPKSTKKKSTSPIIVQTLSAKMQAQVDGAAVQSEINQLKLAIIGKKKRLMRIVGMKQRTQVLMKDIENIETERDAIEVQISALRKLEGYGSREFSVVTPATTMLHAPTSTKKKSFILGFMGIVFLLAAPAAALVVVSILKVTVYDKLIDSGLLDLWPTRPNRISYLKRTVGPLTTLTEDWSQMVALRFQQMSPGKGSVVVTSPVISDDDDGLLMTRVAQYLALRDEKVLIVSTTNDLRERAAFQTSVDAMAPKAKPSSRNAPKDEATALKKGIAELLVREVDQLSDVITQTPTSGVDYMTAGRKHIPIDLLSTGRFSKLIDYLKSQYSVILVVGPQLQDTLALEIHARYADGIMFLVNGKELLSGPMKYSLQSLADLNAPLWGVSVRPPLLKTASQSKGGEDGIILQILVMIARKIYRMSARLTKAGLRRLFPKLRKQNEVLADELVSQDGPEQKQLVESKLASTS
jgi:Mrp family chromosome partitioning ATPase